MRRDHFATGPSPAVAKRSESTSYCPSAFGEKPKTSIETKTDSDEATASRTCPEVSIVIPPSTKTDVLPASSELHVT